MILSFIPPVSPHYSYVSLLCAFFSLWSSIELLFLGDLCLSAISNEVTVVTTCVLSSFSGLFSFPSLTIPLLQDLASIHASCDRVSSWMMLSSVLQLYKRIVPHLGFLLDLCSALCDTNWIFFMADTCFNSLMPEIFLTCAYVHSFTLIC